MSVFLQPLQTVTVGSGGAASVSFTSIPQGYTDLVLKTSARTTGGGNVDNSIFRFNGDSSSLYSMTRLYGSGTSTTSDSQQSGGPNFDAFPASGTTSNTFGSSEYYIPNYAGSNYKSFINDAVNENNGSTAYQVLEAGLYRNTSAITSITITLGSGGNFVQYSKFSLYGVLRQGI